MWPRPGGARRGNPRARDQLGLQQLHVQPHHPGDKTRVHGFRAQICDSDCRQALDQTAGGLPLALEWESAGSEGDDRWRRRQVWRPVNRRRCADNLSGGDDAAHRAGRARGAVRAPMYDQAASTTRTKTIAKAKARSHRTRRESGLRRRLRWSESRPPARLATANWRPVETCRVLIGLVAGKSSHSHSLASDRRRRPLAAGRMCGLGRE